MEQPPSKSRRRRAKHRGTAGAPAPAPSDPEALCGVAMLKVAMELKKRAAAPIEVVIEAVLSTMGLDAKTFRRYLASQGGALQRLEKIRRGERA